MDKESVPDKSLRTLMIAIAAATATTLPVFLTGALTVTFRKELGFNDTEVGALVGIFFLTAVFPSILVGKHVDVLGPERVARVSALVAFASDLGIAITARSFWSLALWLVVAGLANGAMQPAVNLMVFRRVDFGSQGLAFGIKQAAIPAATLLSGLAVPLIVIPFGWPVAFVLAAIYAIVVSLFVRGSSRGAASHSKGTHVVYKLAPLLILTAGIALGAGAANALGAFLIAAGTHAGFSVGTAGYIAAFGSFGSLVSRVLAGHMADRRDGRHFLVVAEMLLGGAVAYVLLATGIKVTFIIAAFVAYAAGWGWNGLFNYAVVLTHQEKPAYATGITQSGAYIGGVVGPLAFGMVVDHFGFTVAWLSAAGGALLAAYTMYLGRKLTLAEVAERETSR
jgi:MFS family permease